MMGILLSYLLELRESRKLSHSIVEVVDIILAAINDWPTDITTLDDYEQGVYELIGKEINKTNLQEYISRINIAENAWQAESLSQLIEIYNYFEAETSLKDIFREIVSQSKR